jgi:hypothetical protein
LGKIFGLMTAIGEALQKQIPHERSKRDELQSLLCA